MSFYLIRYHAACSTAAEGPNFQVPEPAVQHFSTCLELFSGISRYRIWLMTLSEMGAG